MAGDVADIHLITYMLVIKGAFGVQEKLHGSYSEKPHDPIWSWSVLINVSA